MTGFKKRSNSGKRLSCESLERREMLHGSAFNEYGKAYDAWIENYGATGPGVFGDFNGDGMVSNLDFTVLRDVSPSLAESISSLSSDKVLKISGSEANDHLEISLGSDGQSVRLGGSLGNIHLPTDMVFRVEFLGFGGNDLFWNRTAIQASVRGGAGDDVLVGAGINGELHGDKGNDLLELDEGYGSAYGGQGNDLLRGSRTGWSKLYGGDGDDHLSGGLFRSTLWGDEGDDILEAIGRQATLYGSNGHDRLIGSEFKDILFGEDGDDIIFGGDGPDLIADTSGSNQISGGPGRDRVFGLLGQEDELESYEFTQAEGVGRISYGGDFFVVSRELGGITSWDAETNRINRFSTSISAREAVHVEDIQQFDFLDDGSVILVGVPWNGFGGGYSVVSAHHSGGVADSPIGEVALIQLGATLFPSDQVAVTQSGEVLVYRSNEGTVNAYMRGTDGHHDVGVIADGLVKAIAMDEYIYGLDSKNQLLRISSSPELMRTSVQSLVQGSRLGMPPGTYAMRSDGTTFEILPDGSIVLGPESLQWNQTVANGSKVNLVEREGKIAVAVATEVTEVVDIGPKHSLEPASLLATIPSSVQSRAKTTTGTALRIYDLYNVGTTELVMVGEHLEVRHYVRHTGDLFEKYSYPVTQIDSILVYGSRYGDVIRNFSAIPMVVLAGGGDDEILGGYGPDILLGGEGNDTLRGHGGADWISGETGDDQIIYGNGTFASSDGVGLTNLVLNGLPAHRILFLQFDGDGNGNALSLSRTELGSWSQDGKDWGEGNFLSQSQGSIVVDPFLPNDNAREKVISDIIAHLQADFAPFGYSIQRLRGGQSAITGAGATTIFIGASNYRGSATSLGKASGVDVLNDNDTDIAFVDDVQGATDERRAQFVANIIAHEAGHTYGLGHVHTHNKKELMKYGELFGELNVNLETTDLEFVNQGFRWAEHSHEGPEFEKDRKDDYVFQNSHSALDESNWKSKDIPFRLSTNNLGPTLKQEFVYAPSNGLIRRFEIVSWNTHRATYFNATYGLNGEDSRDNAIKVSGIMSGYREYPWSARESGFVEGVVRIWYV